MDLKPIEKLRPFQKFCITIGELPVSYLESMTYLELVMWLIKFLQEQVIPAVNNNAEAVEELQTLFVKLKNYVDNYFDNLDVQDEIDHKLDEMVEDGTLEHILLNFVNVAKVYNTTIEMLEDGANLVNNMKIKTLGYYNINDGGGADFYITDTENSNIYQFPVGSLYAEIICKDNINLRQLGAVGDGLTDDTNALKNALKYLSKVSTLYVPNGNYLISDNFILPHNTEIIGESINGAIITLSNWVGEWCATNENFEYNGTLDTIVIKNLTIYDTKYTTTNTGRCFGLCNTINSIIQNVNFRCDIDTRVSSIDIRSNNKNMTIDRMNCYFTYPTTISRGCLNIREYANYPNNDNKYTDNIHVTNCEMVCSGIDEMVWVDSWYGRLSNIFIDNCKFIDCAKYNSIDNNRNQIAENMLWFSGENIFVRNCYFYKESLRYLVGRIGAQTQRPSSNIEISDCIFEVGDSSISSQTEIIDMRTENVVKPKNINIYNNTFKINVVNVTPLACILGDNSTDAEFNVHDNIFEAPVNTTLINIKKSLNNQIKNSINAFRNIALIINNDIECEQHIIDATTGTPPNSIKILNSNLKCGKRVIARSGNNVIENIIISNCYCDNGEPAIGLYGNQIQTSIIVSNSIFVGELMGYSTNQILTLLSTLINNTILKGIPSNQNLRT